MNSNSDKRSVFWRSRRILAFFLSSLWVILSEFVRNELFLKGYWIEQYKYLGLIFPSSPINGLVWCIWSILFCWLLMRLSDKFSFWDSLFIGWLFGFVLMWLVLANLLVLPWNILWYAVPLSWLEVGVAVWIILRIQEEG